MKTLITAFALSLALGVQEAGPVIASIAPKNPVPSRQAQTLVINGDHFGRDISVTVYGPNGSVTQISRDNIASLRTTSFQITLPLAVAGSYAFVVTNGNGQKSEKFTVTTRAVNQPWIDHVTPETVSKSQEGQVVSLVGGNFVTGLKVSVSDPTGTVRLVDSLDKVTAESVVFRVKFEFSGRYEIIVTNPNGETSNTVVVTVN
jgi:hypothetical protein